MDNSLKLKDGLITCKACRREFGYILKHLSQYPECKSMYSHSDYEMLQKESWRITNENKLILMRSRYNKEQRAKKYQMQKERVAKKYQIQRKDENWMYDRVLKERKRYERLREKEHKEKMENHIQSEKLKICRQNESCKQEVTKCLLHQVKNFKATKSDR